MTPVFLLLIYLALFVGWVMNIIAIVGSLAGPITTLLVARFVGIFAVPLGSILGIFF